MPYRPLALYTHPQSRGRMARWMLEECGATYDTVLLEYGTSMKGADYLAINPMGKVPAIRHGDMVVTEVAAICTYLADQFPLKQLAPAINSPERGSYYRWLFYAAGVVEPAVTAKAMNLLVPEDKRVMAGYGSYADVVHTLDLITTQATEHGGYLCGKHFTAADLYLASQLDWGMRYSILDRKPAWEAYVQPLLQRPAKLRADAIDNELLAQMQQQRQHPQR